MSDDDWISSMDAVLHVRDAGFTEGDLAQWVEAGVLRSRAGRITSSEDEFGEEPRVTPLQSREHVSPRTDGPWPDIPADFWYWLNRSSAPDRANWGAGVFVTTVFEDTEHGPNDYSLHLRLADVTFSLADLKKLTCQVEAPPLLGVLPTSAKPQHKRLEARAHRVAEIIRETQVGRAEAIRVCFSETGWLEVGTKKSNEFALRRTFDLMYKSDGYPFRIDPD